MNSKLLLLRIDYTCYYWHYRNQGNLCFYKSYR